MANVTERFEFLGVGIDAVTIEEACDLVDTAVHEGATVRHACLNAAKAVALRNDSELADAIRSCELVTLDGQPVVWAAALAGSAVPERVAGIDLMEALLTRADVHGRRVFLLGGEPEVLADVVEHVNRRFPGLRIVGHQHGFYDRGSEGAVVERINVSKPDLLFIALPTPEKELFQARHSRALEVPFAMGVGGAFDVLAGRRRRAPRWARRMGLEWAFRLAQEPRRLLWRYVAGNSRFVAVAAREVVRARRRQLAWGSGR